MRLPEYKSALIDKGLSYFISVKLLILETIVSQRPCSNQEVPEKVSTTSIEAMIIKAQLRWNCHVTRMEESNRSKQRKDKEKEVEMKLFRLEEKISNDADENTFALYESVKNELITIANSKAKGTILRSKVRWHEEGEKSTKYFANMEKRNFNNRHITELESDDGVTTTVEKEILKQSATYYRNLYSKNANINNDETKYKDFYNISPDKKLSDVEKESLEGLLIKHECKKALDQLATGKIQSVDGLTSEFYKAFWD